MYHFVKVLNQTEKQIPIEIFILIINFMTDLMLWVNNIYTINKNFKLMLHISGTNYIINKIFN